FLIASRATLSSTAASRASGTGSPAANSRLSKIALSRSSSIPLPPRGRALSRPFANTIDDAGSLLAAGGRRRRRFTGRRLLAPLEQDRAKAMRLARTHPALPDKLEQ